MSGGIYIGCIYCMGRISVGLGRLLVLGRVFVLIIRLDYIVG